MKPTNPDDKPAAKQASLQQLLSAAYVVQQHNEQLQVGQSLDTGSAQILKEVLQVREQLRATSLDSREKAALIARRVRQMAQAQGSAVGIVNKGELEYYAATGSAASQAGAHMPLASSLSRECLQTGHPLHCPVAETDSRLNQELRRKLGLKAFMAIPVKHENAVAGVLELHFAEANSFHEKEVHASQLMASLVMEAILKPAHSQPKQTEIEKPVAPRQESLQPQNSASPAQDSFLLQDKESLLAALEKIRPKLEQLAKNPGVASRQPAAASSSPAADSSEPASSSAGVCRSCGHHLSEEEIFCGICGSPRQTQRIWSSLWELQKKAEHGTHENPADSTVTDDTFDDPLNVFPSELEEIVAQFSKEPLAEKPAKPSDVPLPSFAEGLVSAKIFSSETDSQDTDYGQDSIPQEDIIPENLAPEDVTPENVIPENTELPIPASSSVDPLHENNLPFLLEKSPPRVPLEDEYPPFSGFASDTNLLSLSGDRESTTSSTAHEDSSPADTNASWLGQSSPWGSAVKTKEWLEIQHDKRLWLAKEWQRQRANIYLAAAALLLLAVLLGWGSPSKSSTNSQATNHASEHSQAPPQPDLSLAERLLVDLGLAEVPTQETTNSGNPETQVWVDVHTALYYCPGDNLYGKTPGGHALSQREAQQDQFQPAARKACN